MSHHLFVDHMQGFTSGATSDTSSVIAVVEDCIRDVCSWCAAKRLKLNATKTEILWFGSAVNVRKVSPGSGVISVGQNVIKPVKVVGVLIDGELSMRQLAYM